MATKIPNGKKARITWRFKKADGTDGEVDGQPQVNATLGAVEEVKHNDDGSWSALVSSTQAGASDVSCLADVDLGQGDDAKSEVSFPLTSLEFEAAGRTESVSDVNVTVE